MREIYEIFKSEEKYSYLLPAVVVDNKDPENLGRVKLKFPWNNSETSWVKIAVPMAGNDRGLFFLPEINDEVIVAYLYGDPSCPVVIGFLWNSKDKPPQSDPSIREIKTTSGHKISLDDKEEKIEISNKGGDKIIIEKDKKIKIKTGDSELQIDGSQNEVKITGNISVKIIGTNIQIKGTNIEIKADATLTLKGGIVRIN